MICFPFTGQISKGDFLCAPGCFGVLGVPVYIIPSRTQIFPIFDFFIMIFENFSRLFNKLYNHTYIDTVVN